MMFGEVLDEECEFVFVCLRQLFDIVVWFRCLLYIKYILGRNLLKKFCLNC